MALTENDLYLMQQQMRAFLRASSTLSDSFESIISASRSSTSNTQANTNAVRNNTQSHVDNARAVSGSNKTYLDVVTRLNELKKSIDNVTKGNNNVSSSQNQTNSATNNANAALNSFTNSLGMLSSSSVEYRKAILRQLSSQADDFVDIFEPYKKYIESSALTKGKIKDRNDAAASFNQIMVDIAQDMKNKGASIPDVIVKELQHSLDESNFNNTFIKIVERLKRSENLITSNNKQAIQQFVRQGKALGIADESFLAIAKELKRSRSSVVDANDQYVKAIKNGAYISKRESDKAKRHAIDLSNFNDDLKNKLKDSASVIDQFVSGIKVHVNSITDAELGIADAHNESLKSIKYALDRSLADTQGNLEQFQKDFFNRKLADDLNKNLKEKFDTTFRNLSGQFTNKLVEGSDIGKLTDFVDIQNKVADSLVANQAKVDVQTADIIKQYIDLGNQLGYTSKAFESLKLSLDIFESTGAAKTAPMSTINNLVEEQIAVSSAIDESNARVNSSINKGFSSLHAGLRDYATSSSRTGAPLIGLMTQIRDAQVRSGGGGNGDRLVGDISRAFGEFNNTMATRLIPSLLNIGKQVVGSFTNEYDLLMNKSVEMNRMTAFQLNMTEEQYAAFMTNNKQIWNQASSDQDQMNTWMVKNREMLEHTFGSSPELIGKMGSAFKRLSNYTGMTEQDLTDLSNKIRATGKNTGIANDEMAEMIDRVVESNDMQLQLAKVSGKERKAKVDEIEKIIALTKHLNWTNEAAEQFTKSLMTANHNLGPSELIQSQASIMQLSSLMGELGKQYGVLPEQAHLSSEILQKFAYLSSLPEEFKSKSDREFEATTVANIAQFKAAIDKQVTEKAPGMTEEQKRAAGFAYAQFNDLINKTKDSIQGGIKTALTTAMEQQLKRETGQRPEMADTNDMFKTIDEIQKRKLKQLEEEDKIWKGVLEASADFARTWDAAKNSLVGKTAGDAMNVVGAVVGPIAEGVVQAMVMRRMGIGGAAAGGVAAAEGAATVGAEAAGAEAAAGGIIAALTRGGLWKKLIGGAAGAGLAAWSIMQLAATSGDMKGNTTYFGDDQERKSTKPKTEHPFEQQYKYKPYIPPEKTTEEQNNEKEKVVKTARADGYKPYKDPNVQIEDKPTILPTKKITELELSKQNEQMIELLTKLVTENGGQNENIVAGIVKAGAQLESMSNLFKKWDKTLQDKGIEPLEIPPIPEHSKPPV